MVSKILVDPTVLEDTASRIDTGAGDYERLYTQLYTETEGMGANWQGADNRAYIDKISGFKDDLDQMAKLMNEYATFLREAARLYREAQDEVITNANNLTN